MQRRTLKERLARWWNLNRGRFIDPWEAFYYNQYSGHNSPGPYILCRVYEILSQTREDNVRLWAVTRRALSGTAMHYASNWWCGQAILV